MSDLLSMLLKEFLDVPTPVKKTNDQDPWRRLAKQLRGEMENTAGNADSDAAETGIVRDDNFYGGTPDKNKELVGAEENKLSNYEQKLAARRKELARRRAENAAKNTPVIDGGDGTQQELPTRSSIIPPTPAKEPADSSLPKKTFAPSASKNGRIAQLISRLQKNPQQVSEALVLAEIIGKPLGLRQK